MLLAWLMLVLCVFAAEGRRTLKGQEAVTQGSSTQTLFDALDTNQNGIITSDEIILVLDSIRNSTSGEQDVARVSSLLDSNSDGEISKEEFADRIDDALVGGLGNKMVGCDWDDDQCYDDTCSEFLDDFLISSTTCTRGLGRNRPIANTLLIAVTIWIQRKPYFGMAQARLERTRPGPDIHSMIVGISQIFSTQFITRYIFIQTSFIMMSLSVSPAFSSVAVCQKNCSIRRTAKVTVCKSSSAGRDSNVEMDRRGLLLSAASVVAGLQAIAAPSPAQAFLGLGEDASAIYTDQTQEVIDGIRGALELSPNTDEREKAMGAVKEKTVAWVSRYRRDPKFAGRPSFSQMYSAVNALDGQLVSFGLKANFPAKRLERMMKSIDDAERQLKRGR